ncbi:hypothetical protein [Mergibacter septicus]|uniref:hypothetical protein n=1 Tax=Mergibacter septicus TaxID=221402 RepID=UPI002240A950|nr:hypothetical protein [Mergibacter septicus]
MIQKQNELKMQLDVMIGNLSQAVRAINSGNYIAADVYIEIVQNQLLKTKWKIKEQK